MTDLTDKVARAIIEAMRQDWRQDERNGTFYHIHGTTTVEFDGSVSIKPAARAAIAAVREAEGSELDRLRAENERLRDNCVKANRKREAAEIASANYANFSHEWRVRADRLRAALETIADYAEVMSAEYIAYGGESGHAKTAKLARETLQETDR